MAGRGRLGQGNKGGGGGYLKTITTQADRIKKKKVSDVVFFSSADNTHNTKHVLTANQSKQASSHRTPNPA